MKAFITKYALTDGIQEKEGELYESGDRRYFTNKPVGSGAFHERFFLGPSYWTTDKSVAIKRAEAMRVKKIASLKKQIAKLEGLKFE